MHLALGRAAAASVLLEAAMKLPSPRGQPARRVVRAVRRLPPAAAPAAAAPARVLPPLAWHLSTDAGVEEVQYFRHSMR